MEVMILITGMTLNGINSKQMKKSFSKNKNGFTLIELLLYMAIVGIIIGSISTAFLLYSNGKTKTKVIADVEYSGNYISHLIEQQIRNASNIVSPATSTASGTLALEMTSSTINPTVFKNITNKLFISKGIGTDVQISPSSYIVSSSTFVNTSRPNTAGSISFSFTLKTTSNLNEFSYEQSFYGSATLRK